MIYQPSCQGVTIVSPTPPVGGTPCRLSTSVRLTSLKLFRLDSKKTTPKSISRIVHPKDINLCGAPNSQEHPPNPPPPPFICRAKVNTKQQNLLSQAACSFKQGNKGRLKAFLLTVSNQSQLLKRSALTNYCIDLLATKLSGTSPEKAYKSCIPIHQLLKSSVASKLSISWPLDLCNL